MKVDVVRVVLCVCLMFLLAGCDDHGEVLTDTWRQTLGISDSAGEYRWFAYPVDNFGVATFYDPPNMSEDWTDADRLCATWSCLGIDPNQLESDDRLSVNGVADVGSGGSVNLNKKQSRALGVNLAVPLISKLVTFSGGLDVEDYIDVTVSIDVAHRRSVDRARLTELISGSDNQLLVSKFAAGRLAYVASDIVADGVELTLSTKSSVDSEVKASLAEAYKALAADTSLGFNIQNSDEVSATYRIDHPVILAVLTRQQPHGGVLSSSAADHSEALDVVLPRPAL